MILQTRNICLGFPEPAGLPLAHPGGTEKGNLSYWQVGGTAANKAGILAKPPTFIHLSRKA